MDFFKKLSENVSKTTKSAVAKSKDIAEIAKQNAEIAKTKNSIEREYSKIGKETYNGYINDQENATLSDSLEFIKDSFSKIETLENEILSLKGKILCPACGAELDKDSTFCGKCGEKIEN